MDDYSLLPGDYYRKIEADDEQAIRAETEQAIEQAKKFLKFSDPFYGAPLILKPYYWAKRLVCGALDKISAINNSFLGYLLYFILLSAILGMLLLPIIGSIFVAIEVAKVEMHWILTIISIAGAVLGNVVVAIPVSIVVGALVGALLSLILYPLLIHIFKGVISRSLRAQAEKRKNEIEDELEKARNSVAERYSRKHYDQFSIYEAEFVKRASICRAQFDNDPTVERIVEETASIFENVIKQSLNKSRRSINFSVVCEAFVPKKRFVCSILAGEMKTHFDKRELESKEWVVECFSSFEALQIYAFTLKVRGQLYAKTEKWLKAFNLAKNLNIQPLNRTLFSDMRYERYLRGYYDGFFENAEYVPPHRLRHLSLRLEATLAC